MLQTKMIHAFLLCLLILTVYSSTLPYSQLAYQEQIHTHLPQCILINQTINGVDQQFLKLDIKRLKQQILPSSYNQTEVFAFGCEAQDPITKQQLGMVYSSPGPTVRAISKKKLTIQYTNSIEGEHLFKVDKTLIMDPYKQINVSEIVGVPIVVHAHGMMVQSTSDGYPAAYVTSKGVKGPHYTTEREVENNSFLYEYPLVQREASLWIHDHTIGLTRLNVYAGLTSFLIIDPAQKTYLSDVPKKYDILLNIQDRTFSSDGELFYPSKWEPQYFGKAMLVNGKVWPVLSLKAHQYRLRLLNSCNSRFLKLTFKQDGKSLTFDIIKTDSSYLDQPVKAKQLLLSPGQRTEILIKFKMGEIELTNSANSPYPDGDAVDSETTGKVMKFVIKKPESYSDLQLQKTFKNNRQPITHIDEIRYSVFIQQKAHHSEQGRSLIDGHDMAYPYPNFINGYSYELNLINLTPDSHPFHIHLTQFQVIERRSFNSSSYQKDMLDANGPAPWYNITILPLEKYFTNTTTYAATHQRALKDIVVVNPKQVIKVRFRFLMPDGNEYPFDITQGPGYVWHCHMLEHEDNSMMVAFKMENQRLIEKYKYLIIKCIGVLGGLAVVVVSVICFRRSKKADDTVPLKVMNASELQMQQPNKIQIHDPEHTTQQDLEGSPGQLNPSQQQSESESFQQ